MKIWVKTEEFSEGKFLVTRRDGSTPDWPHFVMGARDPAVPVALEAYAAKAEALGFDPEYVASVYDLATDFRRHREQAGSGDPDAPPHRADNPVVLAMMRREFDVAALAMARAELCAALVPFVDWLGHISATGSRRLEDKEYPTISGMPNMGQLRAALTALSRHDPLAAAAAGFRKR